MAEVADPRLEIRGLEKSFGGTRALSAVDLSIAPGEVHALLGENGAGKSTLTRIVSGVFAADAGSMRLDGKPHAPRSPAEARRAGIAIVHQEPAICPHLSVAENVVLGAEPARFGWVDRARVRAEAGRALALVAPELSPDAASSSLGPAEVQLVTLARALAQTDCRLLILDEPTASLAAPEVERLFEVVRRLASTGIAIVYISHFLEEVERIADRFSVLCDGRQVGSGAIAGTPATRLVELMTGQTLEARRRREPRTGGEVVLSARDLAGTRLPVSASFELRKGEVLGIAGLVGSGRTELLRAIFGLDRVTRGELRVRAELGPASPGRRLAQGVGLSSEDRKREGLAEALSVAENLTLSKLPAWVRPARQASAARRLIEQLGIKTAGPDQPVRALSGGNQQKVALGRLLHHEVDVALLDEPTRGIDVKSRADVYAIIDELASQGKAVLVVSSHFPELLAICDRIAVMHRGRLAAATPVAELTEHRLMLDAAGVG